MTTTQAQPRLFSRHHFPVAAGIIALVTLNAFENRAVMSILPTAARALDGLAWFGPANAAAMVTLMGSVALAGRWVDRAGPRRVLLAGLATFVLAQAVTASAPTMAVFIAGRSLSGLAEGLIDVSLMVFAARALPESLRATVFATFAAAWILPSVIGPGLSGLAEALVGWRAVFILPVALAIPATVLILPALARMPAVADRDASAASDTCGSSDTSDANDSSAKKRSLGPTLALAVAVALVSGGSSLAFEAGGNATAGLISLVIGVVLMAATIRAALPAGTLRFARGIPAVVGLRTVLVFAFGGIGSYLPLMLDVTHNVGPALAGISLTITGVMWAVGSALHSLDAVQSRSDAALRVRVGLVLIAIGGTGPLLLALGVVGLVPGLASWALAATGMGLATPSLSTELFALAPENEQGSATAATQIGASLGSAIATTLGGSLIAARADHLDGGVFAVIIAAPLVVAMFAATRASQIRRA